MKRFASFILCGMLLLCFAACGENAESNTPSTETLPQKTTSTSVQNDVPTEPIFRTENVVRITLYAYYGQGTGSVVPSENMAEIKQWLGEMTIDREATDNDVLAGTNTYYVEIEYADGTIIKEGLDVVIVNGTRYLLKKEKYPACFEEIIAKTDYK